MSLKRFWQQKEMDRLYHRIGVLMPSKSLFPMRNSDYINISIDPAMPENSIGFVQTLSTGERRMQLVKFIGSAREVEVKGTKLK